jgi:alginate O-acetyltransferase complex protein AlgJ
MTTDRRQVAEDEVGHTSVAPWLSKVLTTVFLATIALPSVLQAVHDLDRWRHGERAGPLPQSADILRLPAVGLRAFRSADGRPLARLFSANGETLRAIHAFEDSLEESTLAGAWVRPMVQTVLTRVLGAGNERVYCGRPGWLFYRPAVDHLTGPGFLDRSELARRGAAGSEWQNAPQPDPRPAILEFRDQLADRGIELLLLPVPVKASIHPEQLARGSFARDQPMQNPSFAALLEQLTDQGVRVYDPTPLLMKAKEDDGEDQYLRADTHWTPSAVDMVAGELANEVRRIVRLAERTPTQFVEDAIPVGQAGDLVEMLELPALFDPQTVHIGVVRESTGAEWRSDASAKVLLIGDSFANIYSQRELGWGTGAGLAQRLSYHLQLPVDTVVRNDDGAYATRLALSQQIVADPERLASTEIVVWEFTAREFSFGDWRSASLAPAAPPRGQFFVPERGRVIEVEGTVAALAEVPDPRQAPYADYIVGLHLVDLSSEQSLDGNQAVVFTWAMRDRKLTDGASYRVGQRLRLTLRPWSDVAPRLESVTRGELYENDLLFETPCWGEEATP